jgi:hypothetical protein
METIILRNTEIVYTKMPLLARFLINREIKVAQPVES